MWATNYNYEKLALFINQMKEKNKLSRLIILFKVSVYIEVIISKNDQKKSKIKLIKSRAQKFFFNMRLNKNDNDRNKIIILFINGVYA